MKKNVTVYYSLIMALYSIGFVANVLASSVGGNIIDKFGINTMLLTGTTASAIGTVILWVVMKEIKQKQLEVSK